MSVPLDVLIFEPEPVDQDPFGEGWLMRLIPWNLDGEVDRFDWLRSRLE